jgi:hypothetical protein
VYAVNGNLSAQKIKKNTQAPLDTSKELGMEVNAKKTKYYMYLIARR